MLVYFQDILRQSDILYGHLVIWCISPRFGILYQEKSGNPVRDTGYGGSGRHRQWPKSGHCFDAAVKAFLLIYG
jgi:hypothetical protein